MSSIVQKVSSPIISGGASRTLTFPAAVTAGNLIAVSITGYDSAQAVTWSVTDNKNGVTPYSVASYIAKVITGAENECAGIVYKYNTAGSTGANSFIVTIAFTHGDATVHSQCTIYEISGPGTSDPLDQHNTNFGISTSTNASCTNAGANSGANGIALSALALYGGAGAEAITVTSTGWLNDGVEQDGSGNNPSSNDSKVYTASETSAVTYTHSHTLQQGWVVALATFRDAGAAAVPVTPVDTSQPLRRVMMQDTATPNYQTRQVVTAPLLPQDLSARIQLRGVFSDFAAANFSTRVVVAVPLIPRDLNSRIQARGVYADFVTPNGLPLSSPQPGPFMAPEAPDSPGPPRPLGDFPYPNLALRLSIAPAPVLSLDLSQQVRAKWASTDFAPANLLTQKTLKLPPFAQEELPGWNLGGRGIFTDFTAPNLLSFTLTTPSAPLRSIDLSQQVKGSIPGSDFAPANLLLGILPAPPTVPQDATITIRAKGVFTDFSPPNLPLSTLVPVAPLRAADAFLRLEYRWIRGDDLPINRLALTQAVVTPLLPQDLSGMRIEAMAVRSDFAPPNLTLFLPVPPPPPLSAPAGRHGTRRQARRRRQLDVVRAKLDAFKEQRVEADQALMRAEEGEIQVRAKLLKRVKVKPLTKPLEEYAPVKKAVAQRTVVMEQHRSILEQILSHQLEAERIQREIEDERDEEAALHLMHYLMMETAWYE